jgi:UDP-N-acetylmuramoylalanine--D-glutamate ligase
MIIASLYQNKKIAVLGLGKTGLAACASLKAGGATVLAWDDTPKERKAATAAGHTVTNFDDIEWDNIDGFLPSPGISWKHPFIKAAITAGVPLLSDVDILFEHAPHAIFIGITGTNGKSTTTSLIHHVLNACGIPAQIGGNFGIPTLALTLDTKVFVLEMSSYQLELCEKTRFHRAVFLNLTTDHLERHGTMEGYFAAKMRIFAQQQPSDIAIVGMDDAYGGDAYHTLFLKQTQTVIAIATHALKIPSYFTEFNQLVDAKTSAETAVLDLSKVLALPGIHNAQNIAASFAVANSMGLEDSVIARAIQNFKGLAHRQERVTHHNNVLYINDSKATNADAAAKALACYKNIYWIIGGRPKKGGLTLAEPYYKNITKAYCIGEAEEEFAGYMQAAKIPFSRAGTIENAVKLAHHDAQADGREAVVLLSPACASWDQFANFEARGEKFREVVLGSVGN